MRECIGCKERKLLDEFYKNKTKPLGRTYWCKSCWKERMSEYRQTESYRASSQKREEAKRNGVWVKPVRIARRKRWIPKDRPMRTRFYLLKKFRFTCFYCGRKSPEAELQIDHIIPRARGGTDAEENLVVACRECNIGKSDILLNS